ncbi:hypothetical protein B484DRAFT_9900, partial [Ochromonadaceae sp. CCMP2298]
MYAWSLLLLVAGVSAWRPLSQAPAGVHARRNAVLSKLAGIVLTTATLFSSDAFADSRLNAPSAAGTRVNSDAESLLRYGLPIDNKEIRDVQGSVESVKINIKTRRIPFAKLDAQNARRILTQSKAAIFKAVPSTHEAEATQSYSRMLDEIDPLLSALEAESVAGTGSVQERKGLDDSFAAQDVLAHELTTFQELMVPDSFRRTIPEEYASMPQLQRRAQVQMVIKKPGGAQFDIDGKLYDRVNLLMVVDGYNAPITGGSFVDLVDKGFYNNRPVSQESGNWGIGELGNWGMGNWGTSLPLCALGITAMSHLSPCHLLP